MTLIDRYISKNVVKAIGLVTLILLALQIFILLMNQMADLGKGEYDLLTVIIYIFLELPYQLYLFFPMASLLGALIGLGALANSQELTIARALGLSIGQIAWTVFKVTLPLIILVSFLGESLIPKLTKMANTIKMQALTQGQALKTNQGVWLRHNNRFITIGIIDNSHELQNVSEFVFNKNHQLILSQTIKRIRYQQGQWHAYDIVETQLFSHRIVNKKIASKLWEVKVDPAVLNLSKKGNQEMNLKQLYHYIYTQKYTNQNINRYRFIYWQRIIQPVSTMVMILLSLCFIFGSLRTTTMGTRLLVGTAIGFSFYTMNRFFEPISQVLQLPAATAAVFPTFIFALLTAYLMTKVR